MLVTGKENFLETINYESVHQKISKARKESLQFLREELELL